MNNIQITDLIVLQHTQRLDQINRNGPQLNPKTLKVFPINTFLKNLHLDRIFALG